ncbi:MAG: PLP-dependent aminotransferase family protein [Dysosmobacter sp.]|nr:PLP-dependent aminotransferase family protein [Dysosmobacter sp.]
MLTYPMEERGNLPLYEYLYRRIRGDILSGALTAGTRLPSKRSLAEHLRVSVITVENAYAQLAAEGYLLAKPKQGFFVAQVEQAPPAREPAPIPRLAPPPERTWQLDLKTNRVDASRFPFAAWSRLTRQVLSQEGTALLAPIPHQGLLALREAISQDLRDYRGLSASPEQIVVGAGAEFLYLLLAQLMSQVDVFAVEDPGYPKISQVYRASGVRCVPVPLDDQGLDLDALRRSRATVAHISPSHHYPTGLVMPISRRQGLLRWAAETGGVIIEDDYDSEFRFTGRPIPPLQSIDRDGRVIYMNTFSQTIAPSMRVGFLVLPPQLLDRWRRTMGFYACTVPATEQAVLARFLSSGQYEQHLSRMRNEYRQRRSAVLDAFRQSPFAHRVTITEHGAGLHFLLKLDTLATDQALQRRAEELGIRVGFLSEYAAVPDPAFDHTLVINYAGLEPERLPQAMELLDQLFRE